MLLLAIVPFICYICPPLHAAFGLNAIRVLHLSPLYAAFGHSAIHVLHLSPCLLPFALNPFMCYICPLCMLALAILPFMCYICPLACCLWQYCHSCATFVPFHAAFGHNAIHVLHSQMSTPWSNTLMANIFKIHSLKAKLFCRTTLYTILPTLFQSVTKTIIIDHFHMNGDTILCSLLWCRAGVKKGKNHFLS